MVDLSIVVPAAPGRKERLKCVFSRLSLNRGKHPDIKFEVIIVDNTGEYKEITKNFSNAMSNVDSENCFVKYIFVDLPKSAYPPSYKRNLGFRVAEGKVLTMVDIDWFLSENFIYGATHPLKSKNVLNTGWVIDTNKSEFCKIHGNAGAERINELLLSEEGLNWEMIDIFKKAKIPGPKPSNKVWMWSVFRDEMFKIRGYDENYNKQSSYGLEDDSIYNRLASNLPIYNQQYETFCGTHLYHTTPHRNKPENKLNKDYFSKHDRMVRNPVRNKGHDWGKFTSFAFSIMGGKTREFEEHEQWIKENIGIDAYSRPWQDYQELLDNLGGN